VFFLQIFPSRKTDFNQAAEFGLRLRLPFPPLFFVFEFTSFVSFLSLTQAPGVYIEILVLDEIDRNLDL
jgi:hypothetical protein